MTTRTTDIVLTLTGPDRVGVVEEVTGALLDLGGNVEASRMAHLGGEFAVLVLLSLPEDRVSGLEPAMAHLVEAGYRLTVTPTAPAAGAHAGWLPYRIEVSGADHEGIIHEVAAGLSRRGITIETMDTGTSAAPVSGTPLFWMTALVLVPPVLHEAEWIAEVDGAGRQANVDVTIEAAEEA